MPSDYPLRGILIADSHPVFSAGLKQILENEPGIMVVAEARSEAQIRQLIEVHQPRILLLDLDLPGLRRGSLGTLLADCGPEVHAVVLSGRDEPTAVQLALESGACGFVHKRSSHDIMRQAVRAVLDGGIYLDPTVAGQLLTIRQSTQQRANTATARLPTLTDRERDVFRLIAFGFSNKEIAFRLGITSKSVETYKVRASGKLEIRSRSKIVQYALCQGWLNNPVD